MSDTPNNGHCQQNLRRVVISSLIGAVIEWYDFFLYGVVAGIVFNKIYFPDFDPTVGTVLAFATFAVGFVARPLGGIVFGHFGDKLGRKKMLVLTLEIMGVATVGIGLVPSYESIGILAPILLVLCRLAQGIGIGGEWGGAVLMAFESAPPHKRAFYGSLPQVGLALGLMLASGVIGLLSFFLSDEASWPGAGVWPSSSAPSWWAWVPTSVSPCRRPRTSPPPRRRRPNRSSTPSWPPSNTIPAP